MIDISHAGENTFFDVIKITSKPIIASHSSGYALYPNQRNLKDEQIIAMAKNGGVIQINFNSGFIADRLILQQMRIDEIIVNDVNFVRLLKSMDSSINIDNESQNNYNLIFENQKIRNLLALKLSLTYYAIENRQKLGNEISENSTFEYSKIELLSDMKFENLVSNRIIDAGGLLNSSKKLYSFQDEVLALIENELNK